MREMDPHLKMRRENGSFLELQWDPHCSSRVEMGMWGNFFNCIQGVKEPFEVQEERCDLPRDASAEKGLLSPGGENILDFLELWLVPLQ